MTMNIVKATAKVATSENHGRYNERDHGDPYSFNDIALMIWHMRQDIASIAMLAMANSPSIERAWYTGWLRTIFYLVGICAALKYLDALPYLLALPFLH
jgi:hypothetical protein